MDISSGAAAQIGGAVQVGRQKHALDLMKTRGNKLTQARATRYAVNMRA